MATIDKNTPERFKINSLGFRSVSTIFVASQNTAGKSINQKSDQFNSLESLKHEKNTPEHVIFRVN